MPLFFSITTTFPTVIFSVLLVMAVIYWLISLSGMGDGDLADGDVGGEGVTGLGGLLATLGLQGVPLPLAVTLVALFGWVFSYFSELLLGEWVAAGLLYGLFGTLVVVLSFAFGVFVTSYLIRPLRPLFKPARHLPAEQRLTGTSCTVRSGSVDRTRGRADAYMDGDHFILQVRSDKPLVRGDRAVLIQYLADEDAYWVMPEDDFTTGLAD
ncbi:hypothetical protein HW452_14275 [Halomonas aquamarina]|uniref:Uncharacterized protein n=1 Tax=Vreelandella aquamarina TaxID=77097 RepID=A0ACC5VWS0_9GAMM|nr:hypothetical protein [Halomonas aquamarina]MBZ5488690.1 hypothetical protein [Halomonas aquamarina]